MEVAERHFLLLIVLPRCTLSDLPFGGQVGGVDHCMLLLHPRPLS